MTFSPSPHQLAIGDFIRDGSRGNLIVEAVAGSGKTTTIVWALSLLPVRRPGEMLPQSVSFLAFNKSIADTLKSRCPSHVQCCTFHSLGFRALKGVLGSKVTVEGRKMYGIVARLLSSIDPDFQNILRLCSIAKGSGYGLPGFDHSLESLVAHHDLELVEPSKVLEKTTLALRLSNDDLRQIDFDDMLYLPLLLDAPFTKQDWVFVDEAQDTNSIQLEILERLMHKEVHCLNPNVGEANFAAWTKPPSRLVAVGDPLQAIYGFRGANSDALARIAARFACSSLPLSVSYRCPKLVVAEARKHIERFANLIK